MAKQARQMGGRAFLIDIVRSPFGRGREGGILHATHPVDLFAKTLQALIGRSEIDAAEVDDLIAGCVIQVGEQAANIGRQAWLAAGLPESVPAVTIDRKCGSAQQAMDFAAQGVIAGAYDLVIAGGVEMMSHIAMGSNSMGQDNFGPLHRTQYPDGLVHQGISAELVAAHWDIDRQSLDAFALRSHQLAADAAARGLTGRDIVAIGSADRDEGIRADTSLERLSQLKPAFMNEKMAERYPEIAWRVTAGNSSPVSDGASAMLIASEQAVERLGLKPRAAISHFAVAGDDPIMMLTGIIPATRKLLARANLSLDDIDLFEVNEAFSSVVLAWMREFDVGEKKVNVNGGAIALGHPIGASGGRLTANLLGALEETGGRYGLQTMCESGGMANATLIERLD